MNKSNKTIIKHIPDYLDYLEIEKGLSNLSQQNYQRFLNKFIDWVETKHLTKLAPHQLTSEHLWQYRLFLSRHQAPSTKQMLKKSTQNYYLIALRGLLSFFTERDIQSLPADKIKLAKDSREKSVKFLSLEQIEKLLLAPNMATKIGLRDRSILEVLFSTGLRVAELVNLNREQFNSKEIKKHPDKDLELGIVGKGNRPRTIYFSPRSLYWIVKYLESRQDTDPALFIHYRAPKKVDSLRLTARSMERLVRKYSLLAGLPIATTPHTIRHSYATDLLAQGVDLRAIQEFLGHRNIVTTQIYTHVTNKQLKEIHQKYHSKRVLKD